MLIAASLISVLTGDAISFGFVAVVVVFSITLDLLQEHRAGARRGGAAAQRRAARARLARRSLRGSAGRATGARRLPRVLSPTDFFMNQAALTGEAWPVEKHALDQPGDAADTLGAGHAVFMGSSVVSGSARVLVCATGGATELGRLAHSLSEEPPPSAPTRQAPSPKPSFAWSRCSTRRAGRAGMCSSWRG